MQKILKNTAMKSRNFYLSIASTLGCVVSLAVFLLQPFFDALKNTEIMKYLEQIKSPQWQKKRLEILKRDMFSCNICNDDKSQLHVHHLYYKPNTLIWEYEDESLQTVCDSCHEKLTNDLPKLAGLVAFRILYNNLDVFKL